MLLNFSCEGEHMKTENDQVKLERPKRCFCKIPPAELAKWMHDKYINNLSTMELMQKAATPYERELVTIIAMLDVDEKELDRMLHHETKPGCNLKHCRDAVKKLLLTIVHDKHSASA
jgi:hypothetical protein